MKSKTIVAVERERERVYLLNNVCMKEGVRDDT